MNSKTSEFCMQCVNCGINLKRLKRRWMAEESQELRQLLSDWTCKELDESDITCTECYNLLHLTLKSENKSRRFGHKHVCLTCGFSFSRALSVSLSDLPEHKLVAAQWVPSHQVKRLESICKKCSLKAYRQIKKKEEHSKACGGVSGEMNIKREQYSESNGVKIKIESLQSTLGDGEIDIPMSSDSEDEVIPDKHPQPHTISMLTYKRAADSSSRCIFKHCKQKNWFKLSRLLSERLLIDYSLFIPTHSRVCEAHRINPHQVWGELVNSTKITDFTAAHLENLCSILKNCKYNGYGRNFERAIKQDEYLCKYWFGVDYNQYEEMLKDIEPIKNHLKNLRKSLAMYLIKKHTGFTYEKLATFFNVSTKLLLKIIKRVREYFESKVDTDQSYVAIPTVRENREEIVYYRV